MKTIYEALIPFRDVAVRGMTYRVYASQYANKIDSRYSTPAMPLTLFRRPSAWIWYDDHNLPCAVGQVIYNALEMAYQELLDIEAV